MRSELPILLIFLKPIQDKEKRGEVPDSLFRQTALMIQYGVLEMDVIYNLLGPSDEEIIKDSEKELNEAKEFVRKMTVVSTSQESKKEDDNRCEYSATGVSE